MCTVDPIVTSATSVNGATSGGSTVTISGLVCSGVRRVHLAHADAAGAPRVALCAEEGPQGARVRRVLQHRAAPGARRCQPASGRRRGGSRRRVGGASGSDGSQARLAVVPRAACARSRRCTCGPIDSVVPLSTFNGNFCTVQLSAVPPRMLRTLRSRASVSMGNRVGAACESAVSKLFRILSKYLKNLDEIRKNLCGFHSHMRGHCSHGALSSRPALGPKPAWRWEHGILLPADGSVSVRQLTWLGQYSPAQPVVQTREYS